MERKLKVLILVSGLCWLTSCNTSSKNVMPAKTLTPKSQAQSDKSANTSIGQLLQADHNCFPLPQILDQISKSPTLEMNFYVRNHDIGPHVATTSSSGSQVSSLSDDLRAPYLMISNPIPILVQSFSGDKLEARIDAGLMGDIFNLSDIGDPCVSLRFVDPLTNVKTDLQVKKLETTTVTIHKKTVQSSQNVLMLYSADGTETRTYWLDSSAAHLFVKVEKAVSVPQLKQGSIPLFETKEFVLVLGNTTEAFGLDKSFADLLNYSLADKPKELTDKLAAVASSERVQIIYPTYQMIQNSVSNKEWSKELSPKP
jgi:hypothetical protein